MKHLLSILLIFTLSINCFGQKRSKPAAAKEQIIISKEEPEIEEAPQRYEETVIDTLNLKKGKPYIILVHLNSDEQPDFSEKEELIRNFEKNKLEIIQLEKNCYVNFENKKIFDFNDANEKYKGLYYWSGKMNDPVYEKKDTKMATEFVAKYLGIKKESSYVINTRKYYKEQDLLESKNNITEKSKETMNVLLGTYITPFEKTKNYPVSLFKQSKTKIKTIEAFLIEKNKKIPVRSISLNEKNQPVSIIDYKDQESSKTTFLYKNGLLDKILYNNSYFYNITYDNDKLILSKKSNNPIYHRETIIYFLQNGTLLKKLYYTQNDEADPFDNYIIEDKIENNCKYSYMNNQISSKHCLTADNVYPYINAYTSYQNDNVLQFTKTKTSKKDEKTYIIYNSDASNEEEKDTFTIWGTFKLNEQNLVSSFDFIKRETKKTLKIDYTYYE